MFKKVLIIVLLSIIVNSLSTKFSNLKSQHEPRMLYEYQVDYLSNLTNTTNINEILDNILIPRVVGTPNHNQVHDYIVKALKGLGYSVHIDSFEEKTPNLGPLVFRNIIGTLNPDAERFLVLACHYDSKFFENSVFVGATDSAVPCAMMLNLAEVMKKELNISAKKNGVSLKLLFFDGEEAFVEWGPEDSIYGARHLALEWEKSLHQTDYGLVNDLQKIDILVLLDLLGTPNPIFYSYFTDTQKWYLRLEEAEQKLRKMRLLHSQPNKQRQKYFKRSASGSFVEDDHLPFLEKGVPIIHVIPSKFPSVWHTERDNRQAIDMNTIENLNKIFRVFVAEYLHLKIK